MKPSANTTKDDGSRIRRRVSSHMTRLFDQWSFNAICFLIFLKLLQLAKLLGAKPRENGWRKTAGIFLKGDISKFMLGVFRVTPYSDGVPAADMEEARTRFLTRFGEYLRRHGELHWAIEQRTFRLHRKRLAETDLLEADFRADGTLESVRMAFDPRHPPALPEKDVQTILSLFVRVHNRLDAGDEPTRARKLYRIVKRRVLYLNLAGIGSRMEAVHVLRRVMNASCVSFNPLPAGDEDAILAARMATPESAVFRHPGWGLLNAFVRIHPNLNEADLWIQYHHVPVDGLAMQEVLSELKNEWGEAGGMCFPEPGSPAAAVELQETPRKGLYRARAFYRFDRLLEVRKRLNRDYAAQMRGPATIAGMILWGLAKSPDLHDVKMLFPVDVEPGQAAETGLPPQRFERELSLVFIRPSDFMTHAEEMGGFLSFQREFNGRLKKTRYRCSETYEMLELLSMIHPLFYYYAKYLMPDAFQDVVGTFGLSVLRHAEVFIAPVTDLQIRGFLAFGRMDMPCRGGGTAGCVSICGTREQIQAYLAALERISANYESFLEKT
jgi:hypothetical protein